ncbi:MAG: hypothetical protein WAN66_17445 [Limnoraphis robusta]|uniref:hypothetical protein n=1 Tax=Limnoraphis robusta TaxID=1118279 RepID=UPI002B20D21F|nr:hypothetical protein [Limnoraphis robusta]MEA5541256.1 hypothetical protein [Limnoraphis robusta Tam1]
MFKAVDRFKAIIGYFRVYAISSNVNYPKVFRRIKTMKITFTEILLTATALVTTIGVHAQIAPQKAEATVKLAALDFSESLPLISWYPSKKMTKDTYLCQSASLDLNKSLKSPGT